jgi:hypothetical protein
MVFGSQFTPQIPLNYLTSFCYQLSQESLLGWSKLDINAFQSDYQNGLFRNPKYGSKLYG